MSPKTLRPALATLLVTAVALTLSGCASWGLSQRGWASALERLDGVVSVDWDYHNNWPSSGARYDSTIVVAADLSEAKARAIAKESCLHNTQITEIDLRTTSDRAARRSVEQFGVSNGACIDADTLARFSQVNAAMNALPPGFDGEFLVHGFVDPDEIASADSGPASDSYSVVVAATEDTMLLDALHELHSHLNDTPLSFEANTSDTGSTITMFGSPILAELSPKADLARLEPLITQALKLDRRSITVTDNSVFVNLGSSEALSSAELQEFTRLAAVLGIDGQAAFASLTLPNGNTSSPDAAEEARQTKLFASIVSVPGGASIVAPQPPSGDAITVYPNEVSGVEATAQLLALAPEYQNMFRITAPEPGLFWVDMLSGGQAPQHVSEVFARVTRVRTELAGVDRVIVGLAPLESSLRVVLSNTSTPTDQAQARALLTELARGDTFDEVRLSGPGIAYEDEVID